jgi:predicted phage tail protein
MFELKLTPEDVNNYIKDAILKSSLGENLTRAINKAITDALTGYSSPVKQLVENEIKIQIKHLIETPERRQEIQDAIAREFNEDFLKRLINKSVENAVRYLND